MQRPLPGGRPPAGPPASLPAGLQARPAADDAASLNATSPGDASPEMALLTLAMPLLQLMARLRAMAAQPDPAALRARTEDAIRAFDARAEAAGVADEQRRRAHYVLCAALDDLVLNTPWGSRGAWAAQPLLRLFHPAVPADRFFDLLRQVADKPAGFRPVLALMHACLSLGVLGPLRAEPARAEEARAHAAAVLARTAPPVPAALSGRTDGVSAPFLPRRARFPLWVAAALGAAATGGLYLATLARLNERGDAVFAGMVAAAPSRMPVVTRTPVPVAQAEALQPSAQDRLRARLQPLAGRVIVAGTAAAPVLRIAGRELFVTPNGATLRADATPLLAAVAAAIGALEPAPGRLEVAAYADGRAVRTLPFPSSYALTAARAAAVRGALLRVPGTRATVVAQGRGGADPLASDATPEGRDANRRVEIVPVSLPAAPP